MYIKVLFISVLESCMYFHYVSVFNNCYCYFCYCSRLSLMSDDQIEAHFEALLAGQDQDVTDIDSSNKENEIENRYLYMYTLKYMYSMCMNF